MKDIWTATVKNDSADGFPIQFELLWFGIVKDIFQQCLWHRYIWMVR